MQCSAITLFQCTCLPAVKCFSTRARRNGLRMHKLSIASLIIVLAVTSALMVLPQAKALAQVRTLTLGTAPQSNNVLASGPPDSGDGIVVATAPKNAPLVSAFGVGTILVGQAVSNGKI